jgi:nitroreductase
MNILEAMRVRRSARTYTGEPVDESTIKELVAFLDRSERLCDLKLRFVPMAQDAVGDAMTGVIGSYGAIRNAPFWMIGLSEEGPNDQVNFGYAMEQWVLECTRQGFGTCWVGGFFKMSELAKKVAIDPGERIVCISPFGQAAPRRLGEKAMRTLGGLNRRKPLAERVFHEKWGVPATRYLADKPELGQVFELALWAPSASNKQPCHYIVDDERIVILVLTSLQTKYPDFIAGDRAEDLNFQRVDAGIAMAHVQLAVKELGIGGKWSLEFDESGLRKQYKITPEAKIIGVFDFK